MRGESDRLRALARQMEGLADIVDEHGTGARIEDGELHLSAGHEASRLEKDLRQYLGSMGFQSMIVAVEEADAELD